MSRAIRHTTKNLRAVGDKDRKQGRYLQVVKIMGIDRTLKIGLVRGLKDSVLLEGDVVSVR